MNTHHPSPLGTDTPWPIWALGIFLLVVLTGVTLQMKVYGAAPPEAVSYTHLTLPTNREV